MAYNSAYTGAQIDAAVGAVKQKEGIWDGKQDVPRAVPVTLTAAGWTGGAQTVAVTGVSADETAQLIQPVPSAAGRAAYIEAGILCTGQAADSLTFTADAAPTEDLTVYVVVQEVAV